MASKAAMARINVVLVATSHPGNIGSAARAMKTMGLQRLVLVDPQCEVNGQSRAMASGADDILASIRTVATLEEAVSGCQLVFGTSARSRQLPWPWLPARDIGTPLADYPGAEVALVFGRECSGLTNDELACCHFHVGIPTEDDFSSLNLAQAVQVLAYECRMALSTMPEAKLHDPDPEQNGNWVTQTQLLGLQAHALRVMQRIGMFAATPTQRLSQRMLRLLYRTQLRESEYHIVRGFFSTLEKRLACYEAASSEASSSKAASVEDPS